MRGSGFAKKLSEAVGHGFRRRRNQPPRAQEAEPRWGSDLRFWAKPAPETGLASGNII